jgi:nitrate/nitrite-specific signal transduction histidine kinase
MEEFNQVATRGRWGSALTLRQTQLARLQIELDAELSQLNQNIQQDLTGVLRNIAQTQQTAQMYWGILSVLPFIFALIASWLAFRGIVRPIKHLITDVQRITAGDLSPVQALEQKDEIGDLSRAFKMMTDWLRESYETLDQRVEERTRALERRSNQIQVAAEVARDITSNRDMESLLNHAVTLIPQRFGFYHAGIFMADARGEYAILRAATQETGHEMLRLGHRLRIGETGLVGHVCSTGEPQIALDVGENAVHFKNPHLPLTRSEIALPLKSGERITGALNVQSTEASAFDEDSILILQVMADQLATAIENTYLLQELQNNIQELETLSGNLVRSAWQKQNQSKNIIGYQYDGLIIEPIYPHSSKQDHDKATQQAPIRVPLKIRDHAIGNLEIWPSQEDLSADELSLVKDIGNRISQVLENARLFEESQNKAEREKLTSEITAQLRASNDPQVILETAVTQLQKALKTKRAQILVHTLAEETGSPPPTQTSDLTKGAAT